MEEALKNIKREIEKLPVGKRLNLLEKHIKLEEYIKRKEKESLERGTWATFVYLS